jgi:hypothetical protein
MVLKGTKKEESAAEIIFLLVLPLYNAVFPVEPYKMRDWRMKLHEFNHF